jgi:hypothetical protein
VNRTCPRCDKSSLVVESRVNDAEVAAATEVYCLLCGYRRILTMTKRFVAVDIAPPTRRKPGRPSTGASVRHPISQIALKLKKQGLIT